MIICKLCFYPKNPNCLGEMKVENTIGLLFELEFDIIWDPGIAFLRLLD